VVCTAVYKTSGQERAVPSVASKVDETDQNWSCLTYPDLVQVNETVLVVLWSFFGLSTLRQYTFDIPMKREDTSADAPKTVGFRQGSKWGQVALRTGRRAEWAVVSFDEDQAVTHLTGRLRLARSERPGGEGKMDPRIDHWWLEKAPVGTQAPSDDTSYRFTLSRHNATPLPVRERGCETVI
jgi:hypothetical protein